MLILGMVRGLFKNIFSSELSFFYHFQWVVRWPRVLLTPTHLKSCFFPSPYQTVALCDFLWSLNQFWVTESIWGCIGTFGHQPIYWRFRPKIDSLMFLRVKLIFEAVRTILDPINQWIIVKTNWVWYSEAIKDEKIITQCAGGPLEPQKRLWWGCKKWAFDCKPPWNTPNIYLKHIWYI